MNQAKPMRRRPQRGSNNTRDNRGNQGGNRGRPRRGGPGGNRGHSDNGGRSRKQLLTLKEKYVNLARDALSAGDRVQAELYYQHVEHYSRVVGTMIAQENERRGNRAPEEEGKEAKEDTAATQEEELTGDQKSSDDEDNKANRIDPNVLPPAAIEE